jgi:hypothetical protein
MHNLLIFNFKNAKTNPFSNFFGAFLGANFNIDQSFEY